MNTDHRNRFTANGGDPTSPDQPANWWAEAADRINTWWIHRRQPAAVAIRDWAKATPTRIVVAVAAVLAALIAGVFMVVVWLASAVFGLITAVAADGRDTATAGTHWLAAWRLTRTITDPVHAYLTRHAAALHTSPHLLWTAWLTTTGVLFALAVLGSTGARIGWTLTGALTTAAVYTATPTDSRALAAAITITAWSLLSIPAFRRISHRRRTVLTVITAPATDATATGRPHDTDDPATAG